MILNRLTVAAPMLVLVAVLALAACGVKGDPVRPGSDDDRESAAQESAG